MFRVALLILLLTPFARAEYRVYELVITDSQGGKGRTVLSTLDNIQYAGYNPVRKTEQVAIGDTWMCYKRGDGYQELCAKPNRKP